jgi:hypothetical protein
VSASAAETSSSSALSCSTISAISTDAPGKRFVTTIDSLDVGIKALSRLSATSQQHERRENLLCAGDITGGKGGDVKPCDAPIRAREKRLQGRLQRRLGVRPLLHARIRARAIPRVCRSAD